MENKLQQAIVEQLGYESIEDEEVKQILEDVCRGGGNAGWGGFTYSSEILDFYKSNRDLILSELKEIASDLGQGFLEMILGFNCLKGYDLTLDDLGEIIYGKNYDHDCASLVIDALSWAVLENLAFQFDC